jgi:hypothetical protein
MRTPIVILVGSLLTACSGTRVVYLPAPANDPAPVRPAPPPVIVVAPAPMPPVAVTIARVEDNRLLVSTNQPAYLAVFEIIPNRGLTLAYPTSARQRQLSLAGSNWITVSRWSQDADNYDRDPRRARQSYSERHLYVIASDRPLRLTDDAFNDEYLRTVVGPRAYRADQPYETMAALSRRFVSAVRDEEWGEDLFTTAVARPTVVGRVAKIYCPDGSVTYVREEMASLASCPYRRRRDGADDQPMPPRPDSVVASNGRPVPFHRPDPTKPTPVFRVPKPADVEPVVEQQGNRRMPPPGNPNDGHPNRPGNDNNNGNSNNGNNSNGNNSNGNNNGAGQRGNGQPTDDHDNAKTTRRIGPWGIPIPVTPTKPERPVQAAPPEQKPDNKPDNKPATPPEHKDDPKPKADPNDKHGRAEPAADSTSTSAADSTSDGKRRKGKPRTQEQKQ